MTSAPFSSIQYTYLKANFCNIAYVRSVQVVSECNSDCEWYCTVGLITFEYIKFCGFSNFCLNQNFCGKNFEVMTKFCSARSYSRMATRCAINLSGYHWKRYYRWTSLLVANIPLKIVPCGLTRPITLQGHYHLQYKRLAMRDYTHLLLKISL